MPVSQLIEDIMTGQASQKNDFNIKGLREVLEEIDKTLEYCAKMTDFSDHAGKRQTHRRLACGIRIEFCQQNYSKKLPVNI